MWAGRLGTGSLGDLGSVDFHGCVCALAVIPASYPCPFHPVATHTLPRLPFHRPPTSSSHLPAAALPLTAPRAQPPARVGPSESASDGQTMVELQTVIVWACAAAAVPAALNLLLMTLLLACYTLVCATLVIFVMAMSLGGHGVLGLMTTERPGVGVLIVLPVVVMSMFSLRASGVGPGSALFFSRATGATIGSVPGLPRGLATSPGPRWLPGTPFLPRPSA